MAAMSETTNTPAVLIAVPTDLEAAMIVSALAAHEVDATTAGEYTSGFRAEAPGMVNVLVRGSDVTRAQRVLDELATQRPPESRHPSLAEASSASFPVGWLTVFAIMTLLVYCVFRML